MRKGADMAEQPVGDIIKSITEDVKLLVRDEIELAKAELIPAAKNGGIGGGLFGAAGYFGICATFRSSISRRPSAWSRWAWRVAGLPDRRRRAAADRRHLRRVGYMMIKKVKAPERTIAQANKTVAEVKDAAQRALAAANAPQIEGTVVPDQAIP